MSTTRLGTTIPLRREILEGAKDAAELPGVAKPRTGRSNMEEQGLIRGEKPGTLESLLKDPTSAPYMDFEDSFKPTAPNPGSVSTPTLPVYPFPLLLSL